MAKENVYLAWGLLRAYDLPVREWLKEHWLKRNAKCYFG
jgi:hypothetical protein